MSQKTWRRTVREDTNGLFITIPKDIVKEYDLQDGVTVEIKIQNQKYSLKAKNKDSKIFWFYKLPTRYEEHAKAFWDRE